MGKGEKQLEFLFNILKIYNNYCPTVYYCLFVPPSSAILRTIITIGTVAAGVAASADAVAGDDSVDGDGDDAKNFTNTFFFFAS